MPEDKKILPENQDLSMIAEQRPARHRGNGNVHEAANDKGYLFSGFLFVLLAGVAAAGYWQVSCTKRWLTLVRCLRRPGNS